MARTAEDFLNVLRPLVGLVERPDGSNNAPPITTWYQMQAAWCAMTMSYGLAKSGWSNDGGNTLHMPGVQKTTAKGWAYVDYLIAGFRQAGKYNSTPRPGAIWHLGSGGGAHTGCVERVNGDGTITTLEGNYRNRLARVTRRINSLTGFAHPDFVEGDDDVFTDADKQWILANVVATLNKSADDRRDHIFQIVREEVAKVSTGGIDLEAVSNRIADKLAQRLQS